METRDELDTAAVAYVQAPRGAGKEAPDIEIPAKKARRSGCCGRGGWGRPFMAGSLFGVVFLVLVLVVLVKVLDGKDLKVGIMSNDDGVIETEDDLVVDLGTTGEYTMPKETYVDAVTSVKHPASIRAGDQANELMVLGGGVRKKVIGPINIKVYSATMYVDPVAARDEMDGFKGIRSSELREDDSFFDALKYGRFDKAIRLVIKYGVNRNQMTEALSEQLRPRLSTEENGKGREESIMSDFYSFFTDDSYAVGDVLVFSVTDGKFSFSVNGDTRPEVEDQVLNDAFWGIYCDPTTSIPIARPRFADRAPLLWLRGSATEDVTLSASASTVTAAATADTAFPAVLNATVVGQAISLMFMGASIQRTMKLTVGLYLQKSEESEWSGLSASKLMSLYSSKSDTARALRLVVGADDQSSTLISLLVNKMSPQLSNILGGDPTRVDAAAVQLRNLFPYRLAKNDELYLICTQQNMAMTYNGGVRGVASELGPEVCAALFHTYLGTSSPVKVDELGSYYHTRYAEMLAA